MDQANLHSTEARCTQEHMPKCQAFCPLHMDVRAFMGHMADQKLGEARKIMERHLPLPHIFPHICDHPCESHCLRRDLGGSLAIQHLESLCINQSQKQGRGFLRPPKAKKVAVLGSGLAGLVVAFELAKKSWPVTIFYAAPTEHSHVGGFLHEQYPSLSAEQIQTECNELQKQHANFTPANLKADLLQSVREEFDAIFIDAHAAPEIFAHMNADPSPQTFHIKDNICAAGLASHSPTGHSYMSSSAQAAQGREAALSLERLLGGIDPTAGRESQNKSSLHTSLEGVQTLPAILPTQGQYSLEQAADEAARCIQCQCMQCVKKCVYLQKYGSFPRSYTRQIYNNAAIVQGERRANSLVNGCMLCGQCTEICPERFSMAEVCLQARQDMVSRKYMPPSAHAFALDDMHAATQGQATLFMPAPEGQKTTYAFFPGCQLSATRGEQTIEVYDFLCKHLTEGVGLMLSCCGIPAQWAGHQALAAQNAERLAQQWEQLQKPTLIMACASCKKFFAEFLPHIPCTSLWEVLYDARAHMPPVKTQRTCTLHDPCSARHDEAWQKATRVLAQHCGVLCQESAQNKKTTACCGYGGLVWCAQPELAQEATEQLAQDLGAHTGLASCIMCRDRLIKSGKECLHIFDILPFIDHSNIHNTAAEPVPSLSARRVQRVRLVQALSARFGLTIQTEEVTTAPCQYSIDGHSFLHIKPELLETLESRHILHQDAAAAVLAIEKEGHCFEEKSSSHRVGAWRCGAVTFWVRYAKDAQGQYHLHDAWSHRMFVPRAAVDAEGNIIEKEN